MKSYHLWSLLFLLSILALVSCFFSLPESSGEVGAPQLIQQEENFGDDISLQNNSSPCSETPIEPLATPTSVPNPRSSNRLIDLVIQDLANRLNISPEEIEVLSATFVERPFQEFACEVNQEKITLPAYKIEMEIILRARNRIYQYIAVANRVHYCGIIQND